MNRSEQQPHDPTEPRVEDLTPQQESARPTAEQEESVKGGIIVDWRPDLSAQQQADFRLKIGGAESTG